MSDPASEAARLAPLPEVKSLIEHAERVNGDATVEHAYQILREHHQEFVGVVASNGTHEGVISRGQIGFLLGSRFGFALYGRQPIRNHLLPNALSVSDSTPLRIVIESALSRQGDAFYDDVAVVDATRQFLGMISVHRLVQVQSGLILAQARLAESQQDSLREKNEQLFRSLNELRQSRGRFDILFDNSALGVALVNLRGQTEMRNRRLEGLLGYDDTGQTASDGLLPCFTPADRNTFLNLLRQLEADGDRSSSLVREFTLRLPDRGPRLFKFFLSWIQETGQFCVLLDDVTEQRVLEKRLAQKEKSALLDSLVGGIAHELNNKLAPIVGFAELLVAEIPTSKDPAELTSYCAAIRDSALESAKIIRQLLQLSRPARPELHVDTIRALVTDALSLLGYRLRQAAVELEVNLPPEPIYLQADSAQIKQVLINLVLNALDAMEHRSPRRLRIHGRVQADSTGALISVTDSGAGIPAEILDRIFDPFFTTKPPDRGTGLGLSVCDSIIRQHGGEIHVESTPGVGTTFTLTLPLATKAEVAQSQARLAAEIQPRHTGPTPTSPRSRVLVVDDEVFITGLVHEALRHRLGCQVERVNSGSLAIEQLQRESYDLIISDIRMPGIDGLTLYRWVREHQPHLAAHFLLITGDAGSRELNHQVDNLDVPVLRKPFEIDDLVTSCALLLRPPEPESVGVGAPH